MEKLMPFLVNNAESVLFVTIFAEQLGVPLPAAPLLLTVGALAAQGSINPLTAMMVIIIACLPADLIWFCVGRWSGPSVLQSLGRFLLCDGGCFNRTERLFKRYGTLGLTAAKFFPGLGLLMPPLAGAFKVGLGRFVVFDAIGALLYGTVYLGLGFLFDREVSGVLELAGQFGTGTLLLAMAFAVVFGAWKYIRRHRASKATGKQAAQAAPNAFPTLRGA